MADYNNLELLHVKYSSTYQIINTKLEINYTTINYYFETQCKK